VKLAVGSFLSDDRSDLGRPAVLPLVFFADMDRDPLECIALLFQLSFCTAAAPLLKPALAITDASPAPLSCPDPAHLSASYVCRFSSRP